MSKFKNIFLVLLIVTSIAACSRVESGYVGIKVKLLGGDKGVDTEELGVGRYWIGINEELHVFPTFTQNYVWTKDEKEGSPDDESINFQTVEGLSVGADIGISYRIDPKKVSLIFQRYRKGIEEITDIYLRNMVRDALVIHSSTLPMANVYGAGKADLVAAVEQEVRHQVAPIGIIIERIYWVGNLRLPDSVVKSLNAKIEATQKSQQRRNEVEQSKAEADKRIEDARGVAESIKLKAAADAEAINIKGAALRKNPELLKLSAIEKWDGVLPKFTGNAAIPFIEIVEK